MSEGFSYTTEADLRATVVQMALLTGWMVYSTPDSRKVWPRSTAVGFPDLILLKDGVLLFIELKTEAGKLTITQQNWQAELSKVQGVQTRIWRPSDLEKVGAILGMGKEDAGAYHSGSS